MTTPTPPGVVPIPPLMPGDPPLAFLLDYDGTIATTDVSDAVMAAYVTGEWEALAAVYDAGLSGSRRLMEQEMAMLHADPADLYATAATQPHDPSFVPFARHALGAGVVLEVVSDGFGFFIEPALERLGVPEIPVVTASTTFAGGGASIAFPNGHPTCFVCGTCKRTRVLAHQAAGRTVVFVGNGESDRYAAGYADVVFAKDALLTICRENGWPALAFDAFADVDAWLRTALDAWRRDPAAIPPPAARPYFCGPEVWGPGRWDPPAPAGRPADRPVPSALDLDEGIAPG